MKKKLLDLPAEAVKIIQDIAANINTGKTVIFCGAGISRNSGFPVVDELIPYLLLALCVSREEAHSVPPDSIIQTICERMEVSEQIIHKIIKDLPFEAFIQTLVKNSKIDQILDIYDANAYYPPVDPNTNHVFLAKLVALGKVKTIVTTNFDQLIEKALKKEGKIERKDYDVLYREEDFCDGKIAWDDDRPRLIKIHGSIYDKEAMAITLHSIAKQELSERRASIIRHIFEQGKHNNVLVLGYSCSDVFDLSPQIEALKENLKNVFLVQHSSDQGVEDIREKAERNPFKAFMNSRRLYLDTNRLVRELWKLTLCKKPIHKQPILTALFQFNTTLEKLISKQCGFQLRVIDWKEKVDAWYTDLSQDRTEASRYFIYGALFFNVTELKAAIRNYERALTIYKSNSSIQGEATVLNNMGTIFRHLGDYQSAIDILEKALDITRSIGDLENEGKVLNNMGLAYDNLGDYRQSIGFFEKALEIARRIGDRQGEGAALGNMGSAYANLGEYNKAIEFYVKDLEIARMIGDVQGEGSVLGDMGSAYANLGEYNKAIELHEKALEIAGKLGNVNGEGAALNNMGTVYRNLGDYRQSISFFEKALEIARRIGDRQGEGVALGNMGSAYAHLGEYHKAIEFYLKNLEIARMIGNVRGEGSALNNMGVAHMQLGDYRKAIDIYEKALEIARKIGDRQGEGAALGNMGYTYAHLGEYRKAIDFYVKDLEIARMIGDVRGTGTVLGNMGFAYAIIGYKEKSVKCFQEAIVIFKRLGLRNMREWIDTMAESVGI